MGLIGTFFKAVAGTAVETAKEAIIDGIEMITVEAMRRAKVIVQGIMRHFVQRAVDFMNAVFDKIQSKIRGTLEGGAHIFRKVDGNYQEITRNYSIENEIGEWIETDVSRNVTAEAIPADYFAMLDNSFEHEVNDTKELKNCISY